jgi:hypothetical protein
VRGAFGSALLLVATAASSAFEECTDSPDAPIDAPSARDAAPDVADVADTFDSSDTAFAGCGARRSLLNAFTCCAPSPPDVETACDHYGDGLTYCVCRDDTDCTDSGRLHCRDIRTCDFHSDNIMLVSVCMP